MARLGRGRRKKAIYIRSLSADVARPLPAKQPVVTHQAIRRRTRHRHAPILLRPTRTGLPASSYTPTVKHVYVNPKANRTTRHPRVDARNKALVVRPSYKQPIPPIKTILAVFVHLSRRKANPRLAARNQALIVKPPLRGEAQPGLIKTVLPISVHISRRRAVVRANRHTPQAIIVKPSVRPQIVTLKTIKPITSSITRLRHFVAALRRNSNAILERSSGGVASPPIVDLIGIVCDPLTGVAITCDPLTGTTITNVGLTASAITNDTLSPTAPTNDALTPTAL
jgi:hypothetical protein